MSEFFLTWDVVFFESFSFLKWYFVRGGTFFKDVSVTTLMLFRCHMRYRSIMTVEIADRGRVEQVRKPRYFYLLHARITKFLAHCLESSLREF